MQTSGTRVENNPPKDPAEGGAGSPPAAPQEPKKPSAEELASALNETDLALQKAQDEIVRLKKEDKGKGENPNQDRIAELETEVKGLKEQLSKVVTREEVDPLIEDINATRKRNKQLQDALISKNTTGEGTGQGSHQPEPPTPTQPVETDAERSLRERMEARRIAQGRDPKTGLKINK